MTLRLCRRSFRKRKKAVVVVEVDGGVVGFVDFQPLAPGRVQSWGCGGLVDATAEEDDAFFGFEAIDDVFPILFNAGIGEKVSGIAYGVKSGFMQISKI